MRSVINRVRAYIFDTSVRLQDRSFVVFSCLVLLALYAAVPFGIIMREPLSATISTLVGAVLFSVYVYWVFTKNRIDRARIVVSIVVVVFFLPAMFFTNGGAVSGAPLWLLLGTIYIGLILEGRMRIVMLIINFFMLIACWILGYLFPNLVTEYSRGQAYFDAIAALFIVGGIVYTLIMFCISLFRRDEEEKNLQRMFEQTATALVNAIDAKDEYTHGHSERVAKYSRKIAELSGKSTAECDRIYQIALLHDIGKIGISESIINKAGRLTDKEFEVIKEHPVKGAQILQSVTEYPDLVIGAKYHHERYDGKGYPDGLRGNEIPEIARIISVADAYDAMTSKRSYRKAISQHLVREELVKGMGSQFDPRFARIMIRLLDLDIEYKMQESVTGANVKKVSEFRCESIYNESTDGVVVSRNKTNISFRSRPLESGRDSMPSLIIFDCLDGKVHPGEEENRDLLYFEFAKIGMDGTVEEVNVRKSEVRKNSAGHRGIASGDQGPGEIYEIETVRNRDHLYIKVFGREKSFDVILALPDTARYASVSITGDNCVISDIKVDTDPVRMPSGAIPRIAEEISYTRGRPVGNVPSIEIDGPRFVTTPGVPVTKDMTITFHTLSYPTARLVWHCPYICIFHSSNGRVDGDDYREYLLLKLDGENWDSEEDVDNDVRVEQTAEFEGWKNWMVRNKEGIDCTLKLRREGNMIFLKTRNLGIEVNSITTILDGKKDIYIALTGDQCAMTDINVTERS